MTLTKSLLTVISALALATGTAFAGDGSQWQSMGPETDEALSFEQFSEPMEDREALGYDESDWLSESDRLSLAEPGVINDSDSISESDRLALSEPSLIDEQTAAFTPSVDSEAPLG